jgi:hypothetical protein
MATCQRPCKQIHSIRLDPEQHVDRHKSLRASERSDVVIAFHLGLSPPPTSVCLRRTGTSPLSASPPSTGSARMLERIRTTLPCCRAPEEPAQLCRSFPSAKFIKRLPRSSKCQLA